MALNTKEKILKLIREDKIFEALEALKPFITDDNRLEYETFVNEFQHPKDNFNLFLYKQRLSVFVSWSIEFEREIPDPEPDFYDALCSLDFTPQTDYYTNIVPHKPFVAFLAHGNTDEDGNDLKWLSKQLLYRERKEWERKMPKDAERIDDIVPIDCSLWTSVDSILEQLFNRYDIKVGGYKQLRSQLGSKLRDKLSDGHVVCIMKNAQHILNDNNKLSALFKDLLEVMDEHIVRINNKEHSVIFLFAHNGEAKCQPTNREYFFWVGDSQQDPHAIGAVGCRSQRIIDLAPINHLKSTDVTTWIQASFRLPKVYEKVKQLKGQEATMIGNGATARPFEVIRNICNCLEIKFEDEWIN